MVNISIVYEINLWPFRFDACRSFWLPDGSRFGKSEIIFGADMSSSGHVDNRKERYPNSC